MWRESVTRTAGLSDVGMKIDRASPARPHWADCGGAVSHFAEGQLPMSLQFRQCGGIRLSAPSLAGDTRRSLDDSPDRESGLLADFQVLQGSQPSKSPSRILVQPLSGEDGNAGLTRCSRRKPSNPCGRFWRRLDGPALDDLNHTDTTKAVKLSRRM
jgi:hypothetical protein